jgi:hypothetical protein
LWQFKFACCPQFQEISTVVHQLSCFGVGFLLCLFTGSLFLCLAPFLWDKVSDPSASSLLSVCCDFLLFVFQFCRAAWLWVLLSGSGDGFCGPIPALLKAVAYHVPTIDPPAFPTICLLILCMEISFLPLLPSPVCFQHLAPSAMCYFSVHCLLFIFFFARGSVCQGGYADLSQGWLGEYYVTLGVHLFGLLIVSQAGLESASGMGQSPPVFSV